MSTTYHICKHDSYSFWNPRKAEILQSKYIISTLDPSSLGRSRGLSLAGHLLPSSPLLVGQRTSRINLKGHTSETQQGSSKVTKQETLNKPVIVNGIDY